MLKYLVGITMTAMLPAVIHAQSLEEAKKKLYYEKYNTAKDELHKLVQQDPSNAESWYWLTQTYLENDQLEQAKDTLNAVPANLKEDPWLRSATAEVLLMQNDSNAAKPMLDAALKDTREKNPGILAAAAKATIEAKSGDAQQALEWLNKAIRKDKDNPALYILKGDAYRKLADGGNAYKAYMEALDHDPKYAAAWYKIGKIYTSQKNAAQYLEAFQKAIALDPNYAPALYELYYHYYFTDVAQAKAYLEKYIAASEPSIENQYLHTDVLYASGQYKEALQEADALMAKEGDKVRPRLYKLEAYSHYELGDSAQAANYMRQYFSKNTDTNFVAKDYEAMGNIYAMLPNMQDSAAYFLAKGADLEQDSLKKSAYYKKIGDLYGKEKDYKNQSVWLGKYYESKPNTSNVDLFNWGLAAYLAKDFHAADTVFAMYENKYPTEEFGYYWRARANAGIDTAMETGLAVPHYMDFISKFEKDSATAVTKKHLIEAYGYIAAYKANAEKDYKTSIGYFEKLLQLDPGNNDAKRYMEILKKSLAKSEKGDGTK